MTARGFLARITRLEARSAPIRSDVLREKRGATLDVEREAVAVWIDDPRTVFGILPSQRHRARLAIEGRNGAIGAVVRALDERHSLLLAARTSRLPRRPPFPATATAFNTMLLLLSGVSLVIAERLFRRKARATRPLMIASVVLGAAFVALQGRELVTLFFQGLTLTSSRLGSFFYLVVGMHAAHAAIAIAVLALALARLARGRLAVEAAAERIIRCRRSGCSDRATPIARDLPRRS